MSHAVCKICSQSTQVDQVQMRHWRKESPVCYIPKQDLQEQKTKYFKLTLHNTGNELKVAILASGTPKQILLHMHTAIHVCNQMGLDALILKRQSLLSSLAMN